MQSFNKFIGLGNLTRDPETRYTPKGVACCTLGLALNHKYKQGEETKEEVCFLDVIVYGKTGEACQKFLEKGQEALVEGRMRHRRWEDKETGHKRSKHEVVAASVTFGAKKNGSPASEHHEDAPPLVDEGDVPF